MSHDATKLRRLVEGLDGTREKDLFVDVQSLKITDIRPNRPHVSARTNWHGEGLRGTAQLSVKDRVIPATADAAFTSQSAFEKFVLPYYVRLRTIDELQGMLNKFYARKVICAYHDPSSEIDTADAGIHLLNDDGTVTFI